jgi:hypothetical protein
LSQEQPAITISLCVIVNHAVRFWQAVLGPFRLAGLTITHQSFAVRYNIIYQFLSFVARRCSMNPTSVTSPSDMIDQLDAAIEDCYFGSASGKALDPRDTVERWASAGGAKK